MCVSVGEILRRVIAGSKCICILNFDRFVQIAIPKGYVNLHSPMLCESAHFSTIVPTQIIINLCNFDQFKGQKMVCHCFHLHFPDYYWSWTYSLFTRKVNRQISVVFLSINNKHFENLILEKAPFAIERKQVKLLRSKLQNFIEEYDKRTFAYTEKGYMLLEKKTQFCSDVHFPHVALYNWCNFNKYTKFLELNMILKFIWKKRWLRITEKIS